MMFRVIILTLFIALPNRISGITTTHHDKSEEAKISIEEMTQLSLEDETKDSNSSEIANSERQRRLIPYMTFYLSNNYNQPHQHQQQPQQQPQYQLVPQKLHVQPVYQNKFVVPNYRPKYESPPAIIYRPKVTYTPFLESNKLPGTFTPMLRNQPVHIAQSNHPQYQTQISNEPNYSSIFDKLLQMKQLQNKVPQYTPAPQYQSPKLNIAAQYFTRDYVTRRPPTKYIPVAEYDLPEQEQNYKPQIPSHVKTIIHTYTPASIDIPAEQHKNHNYDNFESVKIYNSPIKNVQINPNNEFKQILVQDIPEKNYDTYVIRPVPKQEHHVKPYRPIYVQYTKVPVTTPQPIYHATPETVYEATPETVYQATPEPVYQQTENPNSLSVILKQLQDSNTLPHTLTPDNIDNSIKTLVHILNSLKNTKLQKPIVVDEISQEEEVDDGSINEKYPLNTPEGGTPGIAGQDYPAYSTIPVTRFNCKTQRYKGFFGDPDTSCQVWHYCDLNGGQASFLCPNGTIFSQVALTCDWWYNVKCATTTQLYVLNERLYKYILPFTPKFPEDYSGPLVDKYLALKFKEMEEKMRKQKIKGKIQKPADDTHEGDVDKLQIIEGETITKQYTTEPPSEEN